MYEIRGVKVKAAKMSLTLKQFTEKITRYIEENKHLKG
jgi:regulator of replication initiation timing